MAKGKILVIDDDVIVRGTLTDILRDAGYQVHVAASGGEALEWAAKDKFDVALVDIKMPDLDGMEMLRALREMDEDLKALVITGYPALETAIQAVRLSAFDYLLKPLDNERVLVGVQNALAARHLAVTKKQLLRDLQRTNERLRRSNRELAAARAELAEVNEGLRIEIAERKRTEEALRESEQRYRTLFNDVPVGLYRTTPEGRIVDVNPALAQMLGYPDRASKLVASAADGYVNPEDRKRWQALMEREGVVPDFEVQWRRRDGTIIWVRESARAVRDGEGRVLYYEGAVEDITERKRAEEELIRLSNAVKMSRDSIVISDLEAKIMDVNEATLEMYGTDDRRDLIGKNSFDLIAPEDREKALTRTREVLETGYLKREEYHIITKDGSRVPVEMSVALMKGTDGKPIGFVGVSRDITERKRAEEELREHRTELQRLSAQLINAQEEERKRLSRELHDELGQVLTAMRFNLAAIEKGLPPGLAPTAREKLSETGSWIDLTVERIRELALDLRPSMLDDLGLVPALRWYVKRYCKTVGIEIELEAIDFEERLPAEVETVLYRVMQEALTNIARHAQANRVHVCLQRKECTVAAFVEDDGQGFDVERVGGREASKRGTGLLGIRERVASLGGSFSLQSRPGQGTRLYIEIPFRP